MKPLTIFLGKLLGIFTLITAFWLLKDRQETVSMVPQMLGNRPLMMIISLVGLAAGLAIVLSHNIWRGGLLPILVTLMGWLLVIRSVLLMFLPYRSIVAILEVIQFGTLFYLYLIIPFLLGALLTILAFSAHTSAGDSLPGERHSWQAV